MTHLDGYFFVLGISLMVAAPLGIAVRNLLALEERVIIPILRVKMASGERQAITCKRAPRVVPVRVQAKHYLAAEPARFTQPGRAV